MKKKREEREVREKVFIVNPILDVRLQAMQMLKDQEELERMCDDIKKNIDKF